VCLSTLWIFFSDTAVLWLFPARDAGYFFSVFKGMVFVVITAALLFLLFWRELTARQQLTERVRGQFEQYRQVFHQCADGIVILDQGGVVRYANPAAQAIFGKKEEELSGGELGIPIALDKGIEIEVLQGGQVHTVELLLSEVTWRGERGFAAILRDVTQRKAALDELARKAAEIRNQFAELDQLYRFAPVALFAVDPDYRFVRANELVSMMNGYPVDYFLERRISDFMPDFEERLKPIFDAVLRDGQVIQDLEIAAPLAMDQGRTHYFLANYFPLRSATGEITGILGAVLDITDRKLAEQAMRRINRELAEVRFAVDVSSLIVITTPEGMINYVNEHYCRLSGYSSSELIGQNPRVFNSGTHPKEFFTEMWATLRSGRVWAGQICNRRKDGTRFWVQATCVPILDEMNRLTQFISIQNDITEQHETAQLFKDIVTGITVNSGMEFFRSLVSGAATALGADGAALVALEPDEAGRARWSPLAVTWDGSVIDADSVPGMTADSVGGASDDAEPSIVRRIRAALGAEHVFVSRLSNRDGQHIGLLVFLKRSPIRLDGRSGAVLKIFTTLAQTELERHQTAANLKKLNQELEMRVTARTAELAKANQEQKELTNLQQAIFDAANYAIVTTDSRGRIRTFNRAAERLTGFTADELVGHKSPLVFHDLEEIRARMDEVSREVGHPISFAYDLFAELLKREQAPEMEATVVRADGSTLPVRESISGIRDAQGNVTGLVGILTDVTQEKHAQELLLRQAEEMRAVNEALTKAARLKDEFIASVSHELRTPLNAVLGLSESLLENIYGPLDERKAKAVRTIQESGTHLLNLINDILDLAKVEAGKLEPHFEPVTIGQTCQAVLRLIRETATRKRIQVILDGDGLDETIVTDERKVKQILMNLLGNAVKFTPTAGTVGLNVTVDETGTSLVLEVWDTGIGIPAEQQSRLFQPFVQLDSRLSRQFGGTGLGLSLVDRLTRLLGGTVSLDSEVGQGSRFRVSLPLQRSDAQPPSVANGVSRKTPTGLPAPSRQWNILLAEDIEDNILVIVDFLESKGIGVDIARDGNEVLQKVAAAFPDLILMDVQMPGVDGLEATRRIRRMKGGEDIPIMALTALAKPEDRERCLAAGMNDYLSKPVRLRDLHARILSALGERIKKSEKV
jgi:PAS domain S-box-containing protein